MKKIDAIHKAACLLVVSTAIASVLSGDSHARTVLLNYGLGFTQGQADAAGNVWNQIQRNCTNGCNDITELTDPLPPLSLVEDLLDSSGATTGIGLAITDPLVNNTQRDAATLPAFTDPENGFLYEHGATGAYHFGRLTSGNNFGTHTLSNLTTGVQYDLTILSARGLGVDVFTDYTIRHGGSNLTASVNSGMNGVSGAYQLLKFADLTADANGQINIDLDSTGINSFINFIRLDYESTAAPLAGDYNGNNVVDAADYTIWRDTLGSTTDLRANGDNSGASANKIDGADYTFWKSQFGNTPGSGSGTINAVGGVPEPSSLCLAIGAIAACLVRRKQSCLPCNNE